MNGKCLDIGTIQAFLDGETRPEDAIRISDHVAACDACTILLAQAEEENSLVFSVLDREMNSLVPTQRLWTRINAEISEQKSRTGFWQRIFGGVAAGLVSPSFATAAGIVVVVGIAAVVISVNTGDGPSTVANNISPAVTTSVPAAPVNEVAVVEPVRVKDTPKSGEAVTASSLPEKEVRRIITANHVETGPKRVNTIQANAGPQYLPGEESYIKTITELQETASVQNASLKASTQIGFERDMAVVDDAIRKLRKVVRHNPRNAAARQVLYSSYQDKIDLLRSSAQREEMMASFQ